MTKFKNTPCCIIKPGANVSNGIKSSRRSQRPVTFSCKIRKNVFSRICKIRSWIIGYHFLVDSENHFSGSDVTLKTLSYRQIYFDGNSKLVEMIGRPNAWKHQDLRWRNGPWTQNDFSVSPGDQVLLSVTKFDSISLGLKVVSGTNWMMLQHLNIANWIINTT